MTDTARRVLIGGGWTPEAAVPCYGPFLEAATAVAAEPVVGCLVLDEGDGDEYYERFAAVLTAVAPCRTVPMLVRLGGVFDPGRLSGLDALLVCGGLTPAYAAALQPAAASVRAWLAGGRPYAGFSAGAAVAAGSAVVGGYRLAGRVVCPPDAGEDLDEVSVVDGLGLVPFSLDVHAAQWGTLGRLVAAVAGGTVRRGIALDEDTALIVDGDSITVAGLGAAHVVSTDVGTVSVRSVSAGATLPAS